MSCHGNDKVRQQSVRTVTIAKTSLGQWDGVQLYVDFPTHLKTCLELNCRVVAFTANKTMKSVILFFFLNK